MNELEIKQLPTRQLEDRLYCELEKEQPDGALVKALMAELKSRIEPPDSEQPALQEAVRQFKENCAADEKRCRTVHKCRHWVWGTVAAAVAICVLLLAVPSKASAESIWDRLVRWTETVFEFFSPADGFFCQDDETPQSEPRVDNEGLREFADTLKELGVTQPVVPKWLPEGSKLTSLTVDEQQAKVRVCAEFDTETNNIKCVVDVYNLNIKCQYFKDDKCVGTYENTNITHYIFSNDDTTTVTWTNQNIECSIYVDDEEEVVYQILDSIYEMED